MGNKQSSTQNKNYKTIVRKASTMKTTNQSWETLIKKQLIQNSDLYLEFEVFDEIIIYNKINQINKTKFLEILKNVMFELKLTYFITINKINKPTHYFIVVTIINFPEPIVANNVVSIEPNYNIPMPNYYNYPPRI